MTERAQEAPFKPLPSAPQTMLITIKLQKKIRTATSTQVFILGSKGLHCFTRSPVPSSPCDVFAHTMHIHAEFPRLFEEAQA